MRRAAFRTVLGIGSILGFGAAALPVQAQVNVPSPPTREEVDRPVPRAEERGPRLEVEGDIERSPCPLRDPSYAGVRLTLNQVTFNNLKGATADEMRAAYAPYLGTEQQVGVLCDIRDAAATMLRRKGYLAAVQVPTQRIENGNVQLEVLYAKITAIRVRGDAGRGEQLVAKYLERLTEDEVFNQNNAERYLLLARDLPGYDVRLTLVPAGTGPGELVGDVAVRRTPYEVDFNVQNLASDDAGHFGGQLRAQFYGLTGMGDRTTLAAYSTLDFQEQQVVQIGHEMRLGSEGLRIGGRFTYAWTKPDIGNFGTTSIKADTLLASLEASYPLLRSQAASVWISGGLELVNQDVDFIGPLSRDRLRIGYVRVLGEAVDLDHGARPRWRMNGTIEFRQGLDILGASDPCNLTCGLTGTPTSRPDGDPTSSVLRAAGEFEVALGSKFSLVARPRAQIAFGPVLSFEEFSGGNYTVGRGFDPGTIVGDDGVGISLELRGPRIRPFENTEFAFQPFVFFDNGWAFDDTRAGAADPQRLTSLGGGFRSRFQDRFQLDVTLAVPTNRAGFLASTPDPRLLFTFTTLLLPWGDR